MYKSNFYTKSIVIKKQIVFILIFLICIIFISSKSTNLISDFFSTKIYKSCIYYHIPVIDSQETKKYINLNMINSISTLLPVLKSNEDMNKKYAKRYSFIKEEIKDTKSKAETQISENTLELDLSTQGITFSNPTNYTVDAATLLSAPLSITPLDNTPRVLIVHTHTSEAYAESEGARNQDPQKSVVKVGEKIAEVLNENGVVTIHDTTQNDSPSYNGSYKKCLATVENNLAMYPTIQVVLDIHRDYIERDSNQLKPTANFDEGKAAQIMFVVGTDSMGLYHPDWRENLSLAVKMQNVLLNTRPNLCRNINMRTERFNHHTTKGSMIIEVGSSANTLDEAVLSGKYIAEALCEVLKKQ